MAGHSIWDSTVPSASPTTYSAKPSNHVTPQATRTSSRFFFNSSPGWNLAESSAKQATNNVHENYDIASFSNGNSLKSLNTQPGLLDMGADMAKRPTAAPQNPTSLDFSTRYEQLKLLDGYKNELIEDLIYRCNALSEQFRKVSDDHDREREYNRTSQRREKTLQENIRRLQMHLDRDPFVLVLIDGDSINFSNELLRNGELGGREAATALYEKLINHLNIAMPELPPDVKIVARVYANLKGLGEACYKAGIVDRPSRVENFAKGFTNCHYLFDFIDVGGGKGRADVKLSEYFKLHLHDYHCRQIVFGCSHGNGYARLLEELTTDQTSRDRVTLLEGFSFEQELQHFNLAKVKLDGIFRDTRFDTYSQKPEMSNVFSPTNGVPVGSSSPTGFPLSRQLSEVDIKDVKDFTPRSAQARAVSLSTDSARPSPVLTWASAVAKPATPVAPPAPSTAVAHVSGAAASKDHIPRNRKGQRVDPVIKHDKSEVDRVKKLKMCNVHFLRGECPYGDSCSHVHQYKPTSAELQTLRLVARMAPCMHGSDCEEPKCIYGHICPAPEGRDGKDCIFGDLCRFPAEMHKIDRQCVKTIKV